jgi:hypothetical protein
MKFAWAKKISSNIIMAVIILVLAIPVAVLPLPKKAEAGFSSCLPAFLKGLALSEAETAQSAAYSVPTMRPDEAQSKGDRTGASESDFLKNCVENAIVFPIARMMLAEMTQSIVQWINSGFEGKPAFLSNPDKFFSDVGDRIAGDFILGTELAFLCKPFQAQIQIALSYQYSAKFVDRAQCRLSEVLGNVDDAFNDLGKSGWSGWMAMTMNTNNNPYGSFLDASSELEARVANKNILETQKLNWGRGFLSYETCGDGKLVYGATKVGSSGAATVAEGELDKKSKENEARRQKEMHDLYDKKGSDSELYALQTKQAAERKQEQEATAANNKTCTIKTPGSTIAGVLDKQLGVPADQLGLAKDLDQIFNALADQLFTTVIKEGLLDSTSHEGNRDRIAKGKLDKLKDDTNIDDGSDPKYDSKTSERAGQAGGKSSDESGKVDSAKKSHTLNNTPNPDLNIAVNTKAESVGFVNGHPTSKIINGNRDDTAGDQYPGFLSIKTDNPWVKITLKDPVGLGRILIFQRSNPGSASVPGAHLFVDIIDETGKVVWTSPQQVQDFQDPIDLSDIPNIRGQSIQVRLDGTGRLELAEVEAYPYALPTITLTGAAVMSVPRNGSFTDPGVTAKDGKGNDIPNTPGTPGIESSNNIQSATSGTYEVTYKAKDSIGAEATLTRKVIVP